METTPLLEKLFGWALQVGWQAAVIVVLILAAQYLLRNRLSANWRYSLWFLLVARLALPVIPPSQWSVYNLVQWPARTASVQAAPSMMPQPASPNSEPAPIAKSAETAAPQILDEVSTLAAVPSTPQNNAKLASVPSTAPQKPFNWQFAGALVWLIGATGMALWLGVLNLRFRRKLASYVPLADEEITNLLKECAGTLGIKSLPVVLETEDVSSPAVYGLRTKRILLPDGLREGLTLNELRHVLMHELAHIKRRDAEVGWLLTLLQIVHWFNPVVWFAFNRLRADREVATDDLALASTQQGERVNYGETILKLLDGLSQRRSVPGLIGMAESKAQIMARIRAIAHGGIRSGWSWLAFGCIVAIACVALTGARNGTAADPTRNEKKGGTLAETNLADQNITKDARNTSDEHYPKVVSVSPANGAADVDLVQELRIRFDRPMKPNRFDLEWETGGFMTTGDFRMESENKEFVIPIRLAPDQQHKILLNKKLNKGEERTFAGGGGFRDGNHELADTYEWQFKTKAFPQSKSGAPVPKVVRVWPPSGSTNVSVMTELKIAFDRPMLSPEWRLPYMKPNMLMNEPNILANATYDPSQNEFTLPVILRLDDDTRLAIEGFYSEEGIPCEPVILHYQTQHVLLGEAYQKAIQASAPECQKILEEMKKARARLYSGIVTVRTSFSPQKDQRFVGMRAQGATFRWQGNTQAYGDISDFMGSRTALFGCDGTVCWAYGEDEGKRCYHSTPLSKTHTEISMADPFNLANQSPKDVKLVYKGMKQRNGQNYHVFQKQKVDHEPFIIGSISEWWIDSKTYLLSELIEYYNSAVQVSRYEYTNLGEKLPVSAFQPPTTEHTEPMFAKGVINPNDEPTLKIRDGSDGHMSGRIGSRGPKRTVSTGMN